MTRGALIVLAACGMATTFPAARQPLVAAGRSCVMKVKDRLAPPSLKTLSVWEGGFRGNDRDSNVINDFWTADIVGLYAITPKPWVVRLGDWLNR